MEGDKKNKFWAGGFLYNPETKRVLLQKRDSKAPINPNIWGFFGGAGEEGETPEECVIREWREELGIEVDKKDLIPFRDYLNEDYDAWRYVFYVKSNRPKSEITLNEGADFDWVPLKEAIYYDASDKTVKDLQLFLEMLEFDRI